MKGQIIAICLVVASGIATFVMSLSTLESLKVTQATYYEQYRFGHVFAHLKRAPNSLAGRIAQIPGVSQVQTRIVEDVTLDIKDMAEPAVGRLISVPNGRELTLNRQHLRSGRFLQPNAKGEVLASEAFVDAHGFEVGDHVLAIINGRRQRLTIVGIVLSPEYILTIRGGDVLPDQKRFGVFWMGEAELAAALDMEGAFNDVSLTLKHNASESEVLKQLDNLAERYGSISAYGRADHLSHRYVSDEIRQLRITAVVAPTIFLSVAAFLLNIVMSRLIGTQREQIAAIKAFGYTKTQIGLHYLKLVFTIMAGGVILGTSAGAWLGRGLTRFYTQFYHFPIFHFDLDPGVVFFAVLLSIAAAVIGTLGAIQSAIRLPPAEAMRPEPPARYRPTVLERWGLQRLLSPTLRMILRRLEREPFKAVLSSLGIAMAVAVLVLGSFIMDAIDYLMTFQFQLAQRQDMSISLVEAASASVIHDMEHLPGVLHCEPFRSLPVRLRFGHRSRRLGIMGLIPDSKLFRLMDADEQVVAIPPGGLLLSTKLAELLGVRVGQTMTVEVQEGFRPMHEIPVAGLITDYSGTNAYMDIRAVQRLMQEGNSVSGAFVTVDSDQLDKLYTTLKTTPHVASVTVKNAMLESFQQTIMENQRRIQVFNVIFASIIAFGVVYNTARISLSQRSRELATLRVIGFTHREISVILLGELAVVTLIAMPIGLVLGYGLAALETMAFDTDLYRIPLVINRSTYAFAATVVIIASILSGLTVRRMLHRLDLIAVLKAKE